MLKKNKKVEKQYVIYSPKVAQHHAKHLKAANSGYWSSKDGWGPLEKATHFAGKDRKTLTLAILGASWDSRFVPVSGLSIKV